MKSSIRDKAESKGHKVKGKVKETLGRIIGNRDMETEGQVEHLKGQVQEKVGDVKKSAGK